ncbi:MAG TPA: hypothetical protein VNQ73_16580 [Ilumatobacter sp.]|nr:hypothetical protein [Ilumatobacter sp.]
MLGISLNPVSWITDAAGAVVGSVAGSVFDGLVGWIEDGMRYVAGAIAAELTGLANVDLGSQTAQQMGGVFKWVAMAVAVGAIMASAAMAAVSPQGSLGDTLREIPITLVLMAGWFGLMTLWVETMTALMAVWTTDALVDGLSGGIGLDVGIAAFIRALVALLLIVFLIVFFIELLVLNHMLTFGVLIGQVAIALRPVRPLRGVSGQMIRNLVTLSVTPVLGVASLALSLGRLEDATVLTFGRALGALAGIVVSVLMPVTVNKFLPLGGQSTSAGRSLIGTGAQVAAAGAMVATGGAALAAGGGLSQFVAVGSPGTPPGSPPGGIGGVGGVSGVGGPTLPGGGMGAAASAGAGASGSGSASGGGPSDAGALAVRAVPRVSGGQGRAATVAASVSSMFDRGADE